MRKKGKHEKEKNHNKETDNEIKQNEAVLEGQMQEVLMDKQDALEENSKNKTENSNTKTKPNLLKKIISSLLLVIFFIGIIISIYEIVDWVKNNRKTEEMVHKISNIVKVNNEKKVSDFEKYNIDFEEFKNINSETIGWLRVEGTEIQYPVVQGKDNSFYLNHSFDKSYNAAGWIFADYRNQFDVNENKNTIIYGHNRRDGSMFCSLKNVLDSNWYENEENRKIVFITKNKKIIYETFSVYETAEELYYMTTDFSSEEEFEKFINTLKARSITDFSVNVSHEDEILTLSTCANNNKYRVVLHAIKSIEQVY